MIRTIGVNKPAYICYLFLTVKCVGCITGRSIDLPVFAFRLLSRLLLLLWLPLWQPQFCVWAYTP